MFLIEIVYMNVYIWQSLSNCTLKMGQVLCQLYLNKVGLKKKNKLCLSILSPSFSFAGVCTRRESEWEFTDSLESGVIQKSSLTQEFLDYNIQLLTYVLVTEFLIHRYDFTTLKE